MTQDVPEQFLVDHRGFVRYQFAVDSSSSINAWKFVSQSGSQHVWHINEETKKLKMHKVTALFTLNLPKTRFFRRFF